MKKDQKKSDKEIWEEQFKSKAIIDAFDTIPATRVPKKIIEASKEKLREAKIKSPLNDLQRDVDILRQELDDVKKILKGYTEKFQKIERRSNRQIPESNQPQPQDSRYLKVHQTI